MSRFVVEVFQNEFLPAGGTEVHAIVSVAAGSGDGPGAPTTNASAAEVIVVDTSASMSARRKLLHARAAAAAAIGQISDGVHFAVLAGSDTARAVYPPVGLAVSSAETRRQAIEALAVTSSRGGTAIGTWLVAVRRLLEHGDFSRRHAILLTDGRNQSERPERLRAAIAECVGRFQCDCRGIGADWEVAELRQIASALLGTLDIIPDPASMEAEFRSMMTASMARQGSDAFVRISVPATATIAFIRQVHPSIEDLTARASTSDGRTFDHPTGTWADERRDYHICVRVPAQESGREMLVCRVSMVSAEELSATALVRAVWTDDSALSTRMNREVAHYAGQAEIAAAVQSGLLARRTGQLETARQEFGRATRLAALSADTEALERLSGVVDILDPTAGDVRLRRNASALDEMIVDTRSQRTVRVHPPD